MLEEEGQNAAEVSCSLEGGFFLMDILLVAVNFDYFSIGPTKLVQMTSF